MGQKERRKEGSIVSINIPFPFFFQGMGGDSRPIGWNDGIRIQNEAQKTHSKMDQTHIHFPLYNLKKFSATPYKFLN